MELEELEKRMEELKAMSEKQEATANYYDTKLHTIIAAYFIWERAFCFAISNKTNSPNYFSSLICHANWRLILALSSLYSLVYILLYLDAALMLYRSELKQNLILNKHAQLYHQISKIKQEFNSIDSSSMEAEEDLILLINSSSTFRRSEERIFYMSTIFCALVCVASLELYACKSILCS
uniref:Uncharacterized protein n=1 Tax=Cucumis sativus TaxID=3659 RepID=A0A0A0L822_CUCSA